MTGPDEEAFRQLAKQDTRKFVITQAFAHGFVTQVIPVMTPDGEHEQQIRIEGPWMEVGYYEEALFIKSSAMPASTVAKFEVVSE
jgi:nicotinic acid phosphoribosyltransferase